MNWVWHYNHWVFFSQSSQFCIHCTWRLNIMVLPTYGGLILTVVFLSEFPFMSSLPGANQKGRAWCALLIQISKFILISCIFFHIDWQALFSLFGCDRELAKSGHFCKIKYYILGLFMHFFCPQGSSQVKNENLIALFLWDTLLYFICYLFSFLILGKEAILHRGRHGKYIQLRHLKRNEETAAYDEGDCTFSYFNSMRCSASFFFLEWELRSCQIIMV